MDAVLYLLRYLVIPIFEWHSPAGFPMASAFGNYASPVALLSAFIVFYHQWLPATPKSLVAIPQSALPIANYLHRYPRALVRLVSAVQ